jgi:hypothetical protein
VERSFQTAAPPTALADGRIRLFTAKAAARVLGCDKRTFRKRAARLGVGPVGRVQDLGPHRAHTAEVWESWSVALIGVAERER